jgi:leucyl/phenylalanyl-tRNA---protein transferase
MVAQLDERLRFPDPRQAVRGGRFDGLVAWGGDLNLERLLLAYRSGIFPWTEKPITWWSPDPRAILELDKLHVSRSLGRTLRRGKFVTTLDRAFDAVMEGCASARSSGDQTWITPAFRSAYGALHRKGHAHSVECWHEGELVGGVYGVSVGGLFAAESMFHRMDDASKVALHALVERLRSGGFSLLDIQVATAATVRLGATVIPRETYLERLAKAVGESRRLS